MKRPFSWDEGDGGVGPLFGFTCIAITLVILLVIGVLS